MSSIKFLLEYSNGQDEFDLEFPTLEEAEQVKIDLEDQGYLVNEEIKHIRL